MSLVSIVMPAYNSSNFIEESINSVLIQSYKNIELIIIDDFSTDCTSSILKRLEDVDDRITVINLTKNEGVANARNIGIDISRGEFIAFIDSDDIWDKNKIAVQIAFMKQNDCKFSYGEYKPFSVGPKGFLFKKSRLPPERLSYNDLISNGNPIGASTTMLEKYYIGSLRFEKVGHEDFLFWLDFLKKNNLEALKFGSTHPLVLYRLHNSSLSSSKIKAALWFWNIVHNKQGIAFATSFKIFLKYAFIGIFLKR